MLIKIKLSDNVRIMQHLYLFIQHRKLCILVDLL